MKCRLRLKKVFDRKWPQKSLWIGPAFLFSSRSTTHKISERCIACAGLMPWDCPLCFQYTLPWPAAEDASSTWEKTKWAFSWQAFLSFFLSDRCNDSGISFVEMIRVKTFHKAVLGFDSNRCEIQWHLVYRAFLWVCFVTTNQLFGSHFKRDLDCGKPAASARAWLWKANDDFNFPYESAIFLNMKK